MNTEAEVAKSPGKRSVDKEALLKVLWILLAAAGSVVLALVIQALTWLPTWARDIELQQRDNVTAIRQLQKTDASSDLASDIRGLRAELAAMRLEVSQRLTRVEAKLETPK